MPGQALAEYIDDVVESKIWWWGTLVAAYWAIVIMDWWRWYWAAPISPVAATAIAIIITIVAAIRFVKVGRTFKAVQQGLHGELAVGQMLEELRARGFRVVHDVPGVDSNIDHVLIGSEGVFAIETKTISKPTEGPKDIVFDERGIHIPGTKLDRDPIIQAQAAAAQVRRELRESLGREFFVRPVVIFPGWFVRKKTRRSDVWVISDGHLQAYLDHEDLRLTESDIAMITSRIEAIANRRE